MSSTASSNHHASLLLLPAPLIAHMMTFLEYVDIIHVIQSHNSLFKLVTNQVKYLWQLLPIFTLSANHPLYFKLHNTQNNVSRMEHNANVLSSLHYCLLKYVRFIKESLFVCGYASGVIDVWSYRSSNMKYIPRLIRSFTAHTAQITAIAFMPDTSDTAVSADTATQDVVVGGSRLLSMSFDSTIRIWHTESGVNIHTIEVEFLPYCVTFSD